MSHSRAVDNLVSTLDNLIKSYRVLLEQVRMEREFLVEAKITELNDLNEEKETLLAKIYSIEEQRQRIVKELSYTYKFDEDTPKLLDLSRLVGGEVGLKLRSAHSTLEILLKRVDDINKGNAELANNALRVAKGALDDIKSTISPKQITYERQGKIQNKSAALPSLVSRDV